MDNQQQHAPPSAGSLDTFVSAVQDAGGDTGTPNSIPIPRNLFNRFPQLPRYLTANASIPLSLDHVAAEEEDAGAEGDDDSVESADEANELTESMIEANLKDWKTWTIALSSLKPMQSKISKTWPVFPSPLPNTSHQQSRQRKESKNLKN
ncbi:hypothetical protein IV203_017744 [Nitzschia inconspicua]|uniref:Uncharacterized protein n=1 Tax=Nitzschia inconspicua TaxID=303405 RepID=A0A9K3K6E9_9STRA|nr:hypothetical protein IV203_017744 [Nitzschia inconspicua]